MTSVAAAGPAECVQASGVLRILVIDEADLVQCGFRLLLGRQPWVERCLPARDAVSALALARRFEPHVALLNTEALKGDPGAFVRELTAAAPGLRVLLLTSADTVVAGALRVLGVAGFVPRKLPARDLLVAIRFAGAGLTVRPQSAIHTATLSARQHEILRLIADGATNSEIATQLYLSRHTVKQHTSALYRKLGARNRIHAIQTAQRQGLIAA
ncbi:MAG: response regulator transcription factor [Sciscionella sp.]